MPGTTMTRREARKIGRAAMRRSGARSSTVRTVDLMRPAQGPAQRRTHALKVTAPAGNGAGRSGWALPVGRPTPTMTDRRWDATLHGEHSR